MLRNSMDCARTLEIIDRRRHHRLPVVLSGRYMLPDRSEHACETVDISPGGVLIRGPAIPERGQRVVVYLAELGRVEGIATRLVRDGFAMSIVATGRKREKLVSTLTWVGNRAALGLSESRRSGRMVPARTSVVLTLPDGREHMARISDLSMTGAAINLAAELTLGGRLLMGSKSARVLREIDTGYALEFVVPLSREELTADIEF